MAPHCSPLPSGSPPRPAYADLSIIVSDSNTGARRLYERTGYREVARRRKIKEDWQNPGTDWVLLLKCA